MTFLLGSGYGMDAAFDHFLKDRKNVEILFNHMNDGLMITNHKREIIIVNPAFEQITGYTRAEAKGKDPSFLASGKTPRTVYNDMWRNIDRVGSWTGELINKRKDGELFWSYITVTEIKQPREEDHYYIGILRDETSRKHQEERLTFLAFHDSLTQLPNRVHFRNSLELALEDAKKSAQKIAVLFLDLDRFKKINDVFGHGAGDQVLVELSKRLKTVAKNKAFVSRFAGDEFTMFVRYEEDDALETLVNELFDAIHVPFLVKEQFFYLTLSIGVSRFPEDGVDVDSLLKNADSAMYEIKSEGKNNFRFYKEGMSEKMVDTLSLESELVDAIKNQELEVYYQVQINLETGKPHGVEALVRWNHPKRGVLPPIVFLPLAEELNLLAYIDEFVLQEAIRQGKTWHNSGLDQLKMSVNISKAFFQEEDFLSIVNRAIEETGMDSSLLSLEVTENMAVLQLQEIRDKLLALKEKGIKVSLDDFGTGYSSLNQLNYFPIDTLKIDQSFVRGNSTKEKEAIIKLIIAMAKSLDVSVICEGVETEKQLELIKEKGCNYAQGYLFSKPVPASECETMLLDLNT